MSASFKPIGATVAASKADKHREWLWCRRKNGFSDLPVWREVSVQLDLPPFQIVAFANRLEELANNAGNLGLGRGYVGHFRASEFAAALGMSAEDASRIFAALEHQDIGWIDQGHVADFYARNRDGDDVDDQTNAERARRSRAFRSALKELGRQAGSGQISGEQRIAAEREIAALKQLARDGQLPEQALRQALFGLLYPSAQLSTRHASRCDGVTVTTEHSSTTAQQTSGPVDNSGAGNRGAEAGQPSEVAADDAQIADAETWLADEAARIVVERMQVLLPRALTLIERWRRDLDQDAVATARVIASFDDARYSKEQFQVGIFQFTQRWQQARDKGEPLPLPPVPIGGASLSTARRHDVTAPAVDNPAVDMPPATTRRSA